MSDETLKAVLVGCGGMGRNQAKILHRLEGFELVGVCDISIDNARAVAEQAGGPDAYGDFAEALRAASPDVAVITTANDTHASLTIQAAEAGVRGVYCEKPMATNLADARAMVDACESRGIPLVINHQRRLGPDLCQARRLIESGALGAVRRIRGQCAGDVLSDGTHLIDSIQWLLDDAPARWVLGQVHRLDTETWTREAQASGRKPKTGYRYGHPVETGATAVYESEATDDGVRVDLLVGDMTEINRVYQDYEIFGEKGTLWRTGDRARPNLFIADAEGGTWEAGLDEWVYKPVPCPDGARGRWRPVELPQPEMETGIPGGMLRFREAILHRAEHPMSGQRALKGFEIVMSVYESARLNRKLYLPLQQDRFPLEAMMEKGTFRD
jgi:predicted dehydrogenase